MKRNKKTRCAAMLFTLCLVTTSIVGGTFAKYTTTGEASDTARVAKFGVVISTGGSLFSNAYVEEYGGNIPVTWNGDYKSGDDSITVSTIQYDADDNIVAPGTASYDEGLTFGISGQPEVSTQLTGEISARDIYLKGGYTYAVMTATDTITNENIKEMASDNTLYYLKNTNNGDRYVLVNTDENPFAKKKFDADDYEFFIMSNEVTVSNDYYPVVYTLDGDTKIDVTDTNGSNSANSIAKALIYSITNNAQIVGDEDITIEGELDEYGLTTYTIDEDSEVIYLPNTDFSKDIKLTGETITWAWDFERTDDKDADLKDTILGDMIVQSEDELNDNDSFVVAYKGNTGKYQALEYDTDNLVTFGDNDVTVASLKTKFNITLTVTQVD
jgi:hypothetical protein